jgi:hypothetical protein
MAEGEHGWKLHLSATETTAFALMEKVLPILVRRGVAFKVARDSEVLGTLNEGALAATQVGKFMTIYSAQEAKEINELAEELIAATPEFRGPKVRRTSIWGALCTLATAASARQ